LGELDFTDFLTVDDLINHLENLRTIHQDKSLKIDTDYFDGSGYETSYGYHAPESDELYLARIASIKIKEKQRQETVEAEERKLLAKLKNKYGG
jgi:hypothetical protein